MITGERDHGGGDNGQAITRPAWQRPGLASSVLGKGTAKVGREGVLLVSFSHCQIEKGERERRLLYFLTLPKMAEGGRKRTVEFVAFRYQCEVII